MKRHPRVVHVDEIEWVEQSTGFVSKRRKLGAAAGGTMIGCSLYEVPPGSKVWPYHFHCANEEAVFVLEGEGVARIDGAEVAIGEGDYLTFPRGPEGAHQITNTSRRPLRYLCISTMSEPDVTVHPDSQKVGIFAGSPPGGDPDARYLARFLDMTAEVDYWKGES